MNPDAVPRRFRIVDAMRSGHGAGRRWSLVGALVATLIALPSVISRWPVTESARSAAELRVAALASATVPFSGDAVSTGGLSLPVGDQLSSIADLLSDRTSMRVWWRGPRDARVDVVTVSGETDVHRDATGAWTWDYEANTATRAPFAPLLLPGPSDLLPTTLADRLLSQAQPSELSTIGAIRVAGRTALGLRITPTETVASVAWVDIWVDPDSGLPLQVQVFGAGEQNPAVDTRFLDLDLDVPSADIISFTPPAHAQVGVDPQGDVLANAGRRLSRVTFPDTLAGLPRQTATGVPSTVGLYGRGVTLLAVVPLPYDLAHDLARAAAQDPTAVSDQLGIRLRAGILGILLATPADSAPYLLTGTVTLDALAAAARALPGLSGAR